MPSEKNMFIVNVVGRIQKDDSVLLIQRSKHDSWMPGERHIPGGKTEYENIEDILETNLIREIHEETGVVAKDFRYIGSHAGIFKSYNILTICFLGDRSMGEPTISDEIDNIKRVSLDTLKNLRKNFLLEILYKQLLQTTQL